MMKLSTMQAVVSTVDERWESRLADQILSHWEHDAERAKYWRASANFVFFFKRFGLDHVLRFNHESERTAGEIQAELDYVNELARSGLHVAKPVQSLAGAAVESIDTSQGVFHAVVFETLRGKQVDLVELAPAQIVAWGNALGELHNVAAQRSYSGRPTWKEHLDFVSQALPADETVARRALDELEEQLGQLAVDERNFGLIHFDFELDNLVWEEIAWAGQKPGIIDFDDCARYWFVADIAFALRDLFGDSAANVDFQNESLMGFVQGYRSVRPIDPDELLLIPLFLRLHNLLTLAKLQRTLTPVDPAGELPWMAELRAKLAAKMDFYRHELARTQAVACLPLAIGMADRQA
ncbi:MAG: phosphotransferase [Caldilineaceae bacterium]|nr:phosphotransferase [Caldilineaceae bacterium]